MAMDKTIVYHGLLAAFGGASHVHYGKRSAVVVFQGAGDRLPVDTIRLPLSQIRHCLDDGARVAEVAKAWRYRNA